jgi:hypothetical protein
MIADALYYIFLPALVSVSRSSPAKHGCVRCGPGHSCASLTLSSTQVNMLAYVGLRRAADTLSFPFSGAELRNMRLEAVEELLDDKIFMLFGSLNLVFVSLTMVQIYYGWENSTRYIWLNLSLCVWYLAVLLGFYKRVWDRTWGARLFCSGHLLFMWIGSAVSGGPVIKVLFEQYAFAAIFSLFALISSVEFSFILFMATALFVFVCQQGLVVTSTDPWFPLDRMEASATYLPVVVTAAVLVHVGARRLIGVYKNRRLVLEYAQAAKQKDEFLRNVTHEIKVRIPSLRFLVFFLIRGC